MKLKIDMRGPEWKGYGTYWQPGVLYRFMSNGGVRWVPWSHEETVEMFSSWDESFIDQDLRGQVCLMLRPVRFSLAVLWNGRIVYPNVCSLARVGDEEKWENF